MNYDDLAGRTAVVTGAASGMGEATALLLARSGARVALLARRADRLADLAAKIEAEGGTAVAIAVDLTDPDGVRSAAERVHEAFGTVDLVVNGAGVMLPNPIAGGREDEWARMIDTNLTGTLRMIRAFVPDLIAAAEQGRTADLVNISSIGAHTVFPDYAVYGATKAAVTQLSAMLRAELSPRRVRVTNLEPGLTATELGNHLDNSELSDQLDGMFSAMDALTAADIADLIAYTTSRPARVNLRQAVILPTQQA
ncbi:SDR family oxidoreductase [Nocardia pseudobrasiliensis]|uniref:NADP-dependent 3-hydroxy acid dehydrogenase YdfG n=1 Tax=Nocardia pseudobrasiliensis TaxID=45979 RepID=A0A370HTG5_9NOCA|nr:SDR family oxidoreductase [Nocardia pseudobrasiliensis]RDI61590.1 NADP-dependent 3-hydroxy acid dehydrogenase YdfG [Nocardia pseudobrasiliensis]